MDVEQIFMHPFVWGLGLGLIACVVVFIRMTLKLRAARKDLHNLQRHLHTKLEIDAEATERRKAEAEKLREEVNNLKVTVQTLRSKPGRKETELLHIYDKAVQMMSQNAPGFASAWQTAVQQAEDDVARYHKGAIPFLRRAIRPASLPQATQSVEDDTKDTP